MGVVDLGRLTEDDGSDAGVGIAALNLYLFESWLDSTAEKTIFLPSANASGPDLAYRFDAAHWLCRNRRVMASDS